ncbi:MAG TPA: sigma-70 family RNA polymerase sigma factor, partial [Pseudomonadales bacterium]|nr:sigma-70 family RNA polymerase sigma factor [Pseudomonadales bacterium]
MYESDAALVAALINREEQAFRIAIRRYQSAMLFLANSIAGEKIGDEVVQEAWFSIIRALPRFEARSSLKTWILRIVANEAKSRLRKENRSTSLDAMTAEDPEFLARYDEAGHWIASEVPMAWSGDSPDELLTSDELRDCLELVIAALPELQGATLRLREQEGYAL